jgi:hypothetical protein
MCGDEHCPSCGLRRVGGLCHGPPCHCAGAKTALQVRLSELGRPDLSADEATYLALKMIANNQEEVDG